MKDLVFLPDREGRDELTDATGFVRCGTGPNAFRALAERLVVRTVESVQGNDAAWRGVLALALLCDTWQKKEAELSILAVDAATSPFAAWVLAARPAAQRQDAVRLVLLKKDGQRKLLGVVEKHSGLTLPATPGDLSAVMPAQVRWFQQDGGVMQDPVPYLGEHERSVLLGRMRLMGLDSPQAIALMRDLENADEPRLQALRNQDEQALEALETRVQAVCGLTDFEALSVQERVCCISGVNPLCNCFTGEDVPADMAGVDRTWLWRGVPFACTSSAAGLLGTDDAQEQAALDEIRAEIAIMSDNSMRWNRQTAQMLQSFVDDRRGSGMLREVRDCLNKTRQMLNEKSRQVQMTITLTWPWDAGSGAVKALLQEALGDGWMNGAANPFADRLTKMTGRLLGDTALQTCCACSEGVLLPPLSRQMADCAANAGEGAGLALDAMRFVPCEDGSITASFLLRGTGEVRMVRTYSLEEICVIDEGQSPIVAVWPCLPMKDWRMYHVFARGEGAQVQALCGGQWHGVPASDAAWSCLRSECYPACLILTQDDLCLGALPNALPVYQCAKERDAVGVISLGSTTTVTALTLDGHSHSAEPQMLTRMLVKPAEMPVDPLLMSLEPASVMPTAVLLNGEGDELFTDGYICRGLNFDGVNALPGVQMRTQLKWRADDQSVRARRILLHQAMLDLCLTAATSGARSIRWRVTIADEMSEEGQHALLDMAEDLAGAVAEETGLPLTEKLDAVSWSEESAALHDYLRGDGAQKGSFMALDLGGCSTRMHLWVQGLPMPVAGAVLLEGTHTQLLRALRERPDMFRADFADCGDPSLIAAVETLSVQLSRAAESHQEADKAMLMLGLLLDEYRSTITQHLSRRMTERRPACLQAVLLEMLGAFMYAAGLMLAQAGDDTLINHRLPDDITICLSGNGAWLLDTMPVSMRNSLQHITRSVMRLDHTVRFVTLRTVREPVEATALGMAAARDTQRMVDAPPVRSRESFSVLMCSLMRQLTGAFPMHQWLLHEGLFDGWGNLTPAGEETIRRVAAQCYGDGEDLPASVMAFIAELRATPVGMQSMY